MKVVLAMATVMAAVAAFDAARGAHWDQLFLLVVVLVLNAIAWALTGVAGAPIRLRRDLRAWVDEHAALTDDTPEAVVGRALAAYRAEFLPRSSGKGA